MEIVTQAARQSQYEIKLSCWRQAWGMSVAHAYADRINFTKAPTTKSTFMGMDLSHEYAEWTYSVECLFNKYNS